jgi:hypothetical protein
MPQPLQSVFRHVCRFIDSTQTLTVGPTAVTAVTAEAATIVMHTPAATTSTPASSSWLAVCVELASISAHTCNLCVQALAVVGAIRKQL